MKRALLVITVVALYILHQDVWFWRATEPLALGFLPIGLFYHACYTLAVSAFMWAMVKYAWPSHLENEIEHSAKMSAREASDQKAEEGQSR